jgi:hypothetical protein
VTLWWFITVFIKDPTIMHRSWATNVLRILLPRFFKKPFHIVLPSTPQLSQWYLPCTVVTGIFYAFIVCSPSLLHLSVTSLSLIWTPWVTNYGAWHSEIFYSIPVRPDALLQQMLLTRLSESRVYYLKKKECCVKSYLGVMSSMTTFPVALPPATECQVVIG